MIIDMHVHTEQGSRCSILGLEEMVRRAKELDLDGVCITEHDRAWSNFKVQELARNNGLVILHGMEVTTHWGHILVYGLPMSFTGVYSVEQLRRIADEHGAFMALAHPFRDCHWEFAQRNMDGQLTLDIEHAAQKQVFDYVEALEVNNGSSREEEVALAHGVSQKLLLPAMGGSDAHAARELGRCATRFFKKISSETELVEELKAGRFEAVDLR
ncbi:MAG: CehA/McbA family metallohydrolase [Bacillota bacterium]